MDDTDKPVLLVHACPDALVTRIAVFETSGNSQWVAELEDTGTRVEMPMFSQPASATVTESTLNSLAADTEYTVSVSGSNFPYSAVGFNLADLKTLGDDEVWAMHPDGKKSVKVAREAFFKAAEESC